MEPLHDLSPLSDWSTYTPDTEGFLPPPPEQFVDGDIEVRACLVLSSDFKLKHATQGLLGCLGDLEIDGTVANNYVSSDSPNPGLVVENTLLRVPLEDRDFAALQQHAMDASAPGGVHVVAPDSVRARNTGHTAS